MALHTMLLVVLLLLPGQAVLGMPLLPRHMQLSALLLLDGLALLGAGGLDGMLLEDPTGGGMTLGAPLGEGEEAFSQEDTRKQERLMSKIEQRKAEIQAQTAAISGRAKPARKSGADVRESMMKRKKISSGKSFSQSSPLSFSRDGDTATVLAGGAAQDDPTDQLPLRERIAARKAEKKAERARRDREADQLGGPTGALAWFRVDEGGAVAFRNTPSLTDRSEVNAKPGDLIEAVDVREGLEDPGEWVQHRANKLWLPVRAHVKLPDPPLRNLTIVGYI